jgi:protein-S-isoprenylcysteine O-methyltransferase Ste14
MLYLLAAVLLDFLVPLPRLVPKPFGLFGIIPMVIGLGIIVWSLRIFKKRGTTHTPHGEPSSLVLHGPYRRTRNPMYLSLSFILIGIAFLTGQMAYFLVPLVFFLSMNFIFIPVEEANLERIFGEAYKTYKTDVKRWI